MHYLGVEGYREKARSVCATRERIGREVSALGLRVHGDPQLGLIAYAATTWTSSRLEADGARGWMSSLLTEPRGIT